MKDKGKEKIQDILHNNGYSTSVLKSISNPRDRKKWYRKKTMGQIYLLR
jgi:hypothetical protein